MTRRTPRVAQQPAAPSADLDFDSPPPERERRYDWPKIAAKAKRTPGKWGLVFRQDKTTYYSAILQDNIAALTSSKGFSVKSANTKRPADGSPRTCDMWVMYDPNSDTTKEGK